ncbi:MAG: PaaI family thioesterase [Syntrophomonas sp.]
MRELNPEHITRLVELINQAPYFKLLSMVIQELSPGCCKVEVDLENKHLNPFGGVHGGVYSSLVDTAAYWAVYCDVAEDAGLISLDVRVDMLAPIKEGRLLVEGKRIKVGRQICIAEAAIMNDEGKLLSHGTSKQMLIPGLQTIAQAMASMGYDALPPKFTE